MTNVRASVALLVLLGAASTARAEDGYDLWLRYQRVENAGLLQQYRTVARQIVVGGDSPTMRAIADELTRGLSELLDTRVPLASAVAAGGTVVAGTPRNAPFIAALAVASDLARVGDEGYLIRSIRDHRGPITVIAANSDIGVLYGAFHFLRLIQTRQAIEGLDVVERPRVQRRVLDHWDNLNGRIERGYAGASLWDWFTLPDYRSRRYVDYARTNASIGINGAVLNNVNADATMLTHEYLVKAAALADVFRPYGIRVYLSARFTAPIDIGGLKTADPLAPEVTAWWAAKTDEIYALIPDFGGFLVKANSEGQPGPQDYHRTHADGANMLADALAPHGGVVMWRAFVYSDVEKDDRAKQAYAEFTPLDGTFRPNVLLQIKNGPIDFQPREPFHPLFGAMPHTPLMLELQITKEYLGFATHLVYLAPAFAEALNADTYAQGRGSLVAKTISGIAGVANTGSDRNWCGSVFACANWHAFGRLAWNPSLSPAALADEWVRMTFTNDRAFVEPVTQIMLASRQTAVDYMTPLGLHHQMARGTHYGPGPWVSGGKRADQTSVYFNRADAIGIGFDRTITGSNAVSQYASPVRDRFASLSTVGDDYLLWFHHVPWDYRMPSGRILWDELTARYCRGVQGVRHMEDVWRAMERNVDAERYDETRAFLSIQEREARWWRDASVLYFQTFSKRPIQADACGAPADTLDHFMAINPGHVPGN